MERCEIGDVTLTPQGDLLRLGDGEAQPTTTWTVAGAQLAVGYLLHWITAQTGTETLHQVATCLTYAQQQLACPPTSE